MSVIGEVSVVGDQQADTGHRSPGNSAGFDAFVRADGTRLLHAAYGMCGDWQHAEDLVQHVLEKVSARWSRLTGDPLAYAYRCLARANIDRWRRRSRRPEVLTAPDVLPVEPSGGFADAVDERGDIVDALADLPRRQRVIVVLRYLQDLSERDTAAALGISVGAVKSGASRGLAGLRERMTRIEGEQ